MTLNNGKPLYLIVNKVNGYIVIHNGNKYLVLVHSDKSKDAWRKYEELMKKIKAIIGSISNSLDNYDQKYMKIRFSSDDDNLALHEMIKWIELFSIRTANTIQKFFWWMFVRIRSVKCECSSMMELTSQKA